MNRTSCEARVFPFRADRRARVRGRHKPRRAAATMVEMAIALSVFTTLMLGMIDLGYGLFQQHILTQTTRMVARKAIVRGALAERLEPWGPDPVTTSADSESPIAQAAARTLVGWDLSRVRINVDWIDDSNDPRENARVRVHLTAPYRPVITFLFGNPAINLNADSTMQVAH